MPRKEYNNDSINGFTMPPSAPAEPDSSEPGSEPESLYGYRFRGRPTEPDSGTHTSEIGQPATIIDDSANGTTRVQPVVGWLVCVSGIDQGKDFRLHSGQNKIGRGSTLDVILSDPHVSREHVLEISYDPLTNAFYIRTGGGKCLRYLNREPLMEIRRLTPYDRIQLAIDNGGVAEIICELLFVPLCGDQFSWAKPQKEA